jgi:hypothetical protein
MIDLGQFEKARPIFEEILQVEPPEVLEAQIRKSVMFQALKGWLSALKARYCSSNCLALSALAFAHPNLCLAFC